MIQYNEIQPLRFFEDKTELQQHNYYEKNHFNIKHSLVYCPSDRFIAFAFNIPTSLFVIDSCKLYCANDSTVVYDLKTRLVNATDLRVNSYTNQQTGDNIHRVEYQPSEGFILSAVKDYIPERVCYCKIVVKNPGTGETKAYRSDFCEIYGSAQSVSLIAVEFDHTLIRTAL